MKKRKLFFFDLVIFRRQHAPMVYRGYVIETNQARAEDQMKAWAAEKKALEEDMFLSMSWQGQYILWSVAKKHLDIVDGAEDIEEYLRLQKRNESSKTVPPSMQSFEVQMEAFFRGEN